MKKVLFILLITMSLGGCVTYEGYVDQDRLLCEQTEFVDKDGMKHITFYYSHESEACDYGL